MKQVIDNHYSLPTADINWQGNHPVSSYYNDGYWAVGNVLAEKSHVFSGHHRLQEKAINSDFFTIIETGFGFGNNFLLSCQQWKASGSSGILHYVGVEKAPPSRQDLNRHLSQLDLPLSSWLAENYPLPIKTRFTLWPAENIRLTLVFDQVDQALADFNFSADVWYLDGFSPKSNPDLWNQAVYNQMYRNSKPGTTLSSFTVAGKVREGLSKAGFTVFKAPGFGAKKEMLSGYKPGRWQPSTIERLKTVIIGAGIAGRSVQSALTKRGFQTTLLASPQVPAASNVPTMNLYPQLSAVADQKSKYSISANHYALQNTKEVQRSTLTWKSTARQRMQRMRTIARQFPDQYMSEQDDSILFHEAGVASATPIRTEQRHVADLQQINDGWRLLDQQGKEIMQAQQVVLAAGAGMNDLQPIPLKLVRGQSILAQSNNKITQVTSGDISIANIGDQLFHVGSTYQPDDCDLTDRLEDSNYLLALLERRFPLSDWSLDSSFVGVRAAPVDRNPIVGPLPQWQLLQQQPFSWYQNQSIPAQKGLYCIAGFGSKGGSHGPLAGEHLANLITGEPTPLTGSQQKYFSPARFWLQQANKKTARKRHDHR